MEFLSKTTPLSVALPVIKVLGLGGGGCNAVNRMIELGIAGVEFIAANSDYQALKTSLAPTQILLGQTVTRGLGAGGRPEIGRAAAEESQREIAAALQGADMVFVTAGMGGGTGTGSIPVAAQAARSVGAVTIAVVTTPFSFEMGRRQRNASDGLAALRPHTDTLIAIPNDRLLYLASRSLTLEVAFRMADDVLRQAVQGITELVTEPGLINVDFSHIRRLMKLGGGALMAIGQGQGSNKAHEAIERALHHPMLDDIDLENAAGIIANFTGGEDLALFEISEVLNRLHTQVGSTTEIVLGVTHDECMTGRAQVILVITGLGGTTLEEAVSNVSEQAQKMVESAAAITPGPPPRPAEPSQPSLFHRRESYPPIPEQVEPSAEPMTVAMQSPIANNLDIPAFLRRRIRQGSSAAAG